MHGTEQNLQNGSDTGEALQPTTIEAWLWNTFVVRYRSHIVWSLALLLASGSTAIVAGYGGRVWRISSTEQTLKAINADYAWLHQTRDLIKWERPKQSQAMWAGKLGNPVVSDISLVRIRDGNLNDEQLSFLENLRQVRAFELQSNVATDKTLETISRLPNLRYLTLIGENFSVFGLLKLRNAPSLVQIRCDMQKYTPIELAVLQAELPGVRISNARTDSYEPYRISGHGFTPAA